MQDDEAPLSAAEITLEQVRARLAEQLHVTRRQENRIAELEASNTRLRERLAWYRPTPGSKRDIDTSTRLATLPYPVRVETLKNELALIRVEEDAERGVLWIG